jgi:FMN phosphatase YigB (HAD superfamily)
LKEDCLFIDDRGSNIEKALDFGFTPLLFPSEASYGAKYLSGVFMKMEI